MPRMHLVIMRLNSFNKRKRKNLLSFYILPIPPLIFPWKHPLLQGIPT